MARKPRIEYPGALYHVIARGNRKEPVFFDRRDKGRFMDKLKEYKEMYDFTLYAYVLMDNHIHLLIETAEVPLSKIMQGILQSHTQWHNRRYETAGHLFQGRYKAILCDQNSYLLALVRYIHLNPLRAEMPRPWTYYWSSHKAYTGVAVDDFVDTGLVLEQFSRRKRESVKLYLEFLAQGTQEDGKKYYRVRDQRILGDEEFYEEAIGKTRERSGTGHILRNKTLTDICVLVNRATGVDSEDMKGETRSKEAMEARALFIRLSRMHTLSSVSRIAEFLNRTAGSLAHIERKLTDERFASLCEIRKSGLP
jgi:REP element-mobilizing transposase RayT